MGEVEVIAPGQQRIHIVAADPALHFREARDDFVGLTGAKREQIAGQTEHRRIGPEFRQITRSRTQNFAPAIGEDRFHGDDVFARVAIAERARAAGIVGGHAADGGARRGRDVDREPQAMRFERAVEIVQHDAGLDRAALVFNVDVDDSIEIFRAVEHQRGIHRLPALRGAAAARQHRDALLARDLDRAGRIVDRARRHHALRHHLVMGGIGRIAPAREAVEPDLARDLCSQPPLQPRPQCVRQTLLLPASIARLYMPKAIARYELCT